jgi:hypothetical protein
MNRLHDKWMNRPQPKLMNRPHGAFITIGGNYFCYSLTDAFDLRSYPIG